MSELVMICPSRNRPQAAVELVDDFERTCTEDTLLVFAVDDDDPTQDIYFEAVLGRDRAAVGIVEDPKTMVWALNRAAWAAATVFVPPPFAIGFLGDDHHPRTHGWDKIYLDALRELGSGIVYGDDLLQGERLPTQCAMTADIVRALGHMAAPVLAHMYVDNYWKDLGQAAGCLRYLPGVVVEHMHPAAHKAAWDDGYRRVNADDVYQADAQAHATWTLEQLDREVAVVRGLR
jgi:hypothetical protein